MLVWSTQWGSRLATLLEVQESTGITPKALLDRPTLTSYQSEIYQAFVELSESRPYSMNGPLPINLQTFMAYCQLYDLSRQDVEDLWQFIRALDRTWLEKVNADQAAAAKSKSKKT